MNTFFCVETERFSHTYRHYFNSVEAVRAFLKSTRDGWELFRAEWDDGELVRVPPYIIECNAVDEAGGIDAVLDRLEAAA